jgi:hypothetical protein
MEDLFPAEAGTWWVYLVDGRGVTDTGEEYDIQGISCLMVTSTRSAPGLTYVDTRQDRHIAAISAGDTLDVLSGTESVTYACRDNTVFQVTSESRGTGIRLLRFPLEVGAGWAADDRPDAAVFTVDSLMESFRTPAGELGPAWLVTRDGAPTVLAEGVGQVYKEDRFSRAGGTEVYRYTLADCSLLDAPVLAETDSVPAMPELFPCPMGASWEYSVSGAGSVGDGMEVRVTGSGMRWVDGVIEHLGGTPLVLVKLESSIRMELPGGGVDSSRHVTAELFAAGPEGGVLSLMSPMDRDPVLYLPADGADAPDWTCRTDGVSWECTAAAVAGEVEVPAGSWNGCLSLQSSAESAGRSRETVLAPQVGPVRAVMTMPVGDGSVQTVMDLTGFSLSR